MLYYLYGRQAIERGRADVSAGRTIAHEERSITARSGMKATMRIAAPQVGHRNGLTLKICWRSPGHRRRAPRRASGTGSTTGVGTAVPT
jgi:hypothetical protein